MIHYPMINPIAFHIGPLAVHWYGLMYLLGFLVGWFLLRTRIKQLNISKEQLSDIVFYTALGVILGGRIGYMLFYNFQVFIHKPWEVVKVWQGGMSFHGGLIGVMIALWFCARKMGKTMVDLGDFIAPVIPIGLGAGRIGNFINDELWGRVTNVPWAIEFPSGGYLPRHPSQLYEFLLEGVVLFSILWIYSMKKRPQWAVSGLFLFFYGLFRFSIEFFREPDVQVGFIAFGWMTKGQLLSLPMIMIGLVMFIWAHNCKRYTSCNNI